MVKKKINIDYLIEIVARGGKVKTGIDVYNKKGILLLDKNVLVDSARTLEVIKENGINSVPFVEGKESGIWNAGGDSISVSKEGELDYKTGVQDDVHKAIAVSGIEKRLKEIDELKHIAEEKYVRAKSSIKKVMGDIKETGGEFDYNEVEEQVFDLVEFLSTAENPFSYLTKEIFSYDDYLYNHSVNVCAIGTAVLNRFNTSFSSVVNGHLKAGTSSVYNPFEKKSGKENNAYMCYQKDEIRDIATGFFLHDIGKVMIPEETLNKSGKLTSEDFSLVKQHSYRFGLEILEQNKLKNLFIKNMVVYHHAALYINEEKSYPHDRPPAEIPLYVKMGKLADIFDAMTSKRCYKDAFNPINVVTSIFRKYAKKDTMLQYVLHAFVKSIGIYPPGSIVFLRNGQMAYVLESSGPLVLPFTDAEEKTLSIKPDPIDLSSPDLDEAIMVDNRRSLKLPMDVYDILPPHLKPKNLETS
ncbi:MAG: HD domain-containing protein [Thermodesulfobacteriota bacterium]|nr:HD domain-containing protein [Thermodesulfobacteriota bacterium]